MSNIIVDTTPTNLLAEKQKFFANPTYNPQFTYRREINPEELIEWGVPKKKFFDHAQKKLSDYCLVRNGPLPPPQTIVTEDDVLKMVATFNHNYALEKPVEVIFDPSLVTRCRVNQNKIYFQIPLTYTPSKLNDLARHELETHMLRHVNHQGQPWAETKIPDPVFRATEEGLAGLHTHLWREDKVVRKSYITYSAVYVAQHYDFVTVFQALKELQVSDPTAWNIAVRSKRGLTDTSQPGGLTKDITYFEGAVLVWAWLMDQGHNPYDLYLGKIGLSQIEEFKAHAHFDHLRYPTFFFDLEKYYDAMYQIGQVNAFEELL